PGAAGGRSTPRSRGGGRARAQPPRRRRARGGRASASLRRPRRRGGTRPRTPSARRSAPARSPGSAPQPPTRARSDAIFVRAASSSPLPVIHQLPSVAASATTIQPPSPSATSAAARAPNRAGPSEVPGGRQSSPGWHGPLSTSSIVAPSGLRYEIWRMPPLLRWYSPLSTNQPLGRTGQYTSNARALAASAWRSRFVSVARPQLAAPAA